MFGVSGYKHLLSEESHLFLIRLPVEGRLGSGGPVLSSSDGNLRQKCLLRRV